MNNKVIICGDYGIIIGSKDQNDETSNANTG